MTVQASSAAVAGLLGLMFPLFIFGSPFLNIERFFLTSHFLP